MKQKLTPLTRVIALVASCAMFVVLSLPIWRIELTAPQYPEGLVLKIYADRIAGDVDVVNGLNHYIGMHTLHTRDFVEFIALPFIIGGFAFLGLITVVLNRKGPFYIWAGLFLLIAFISMVDFYRWEYNYGHNLDPAAPIQVPGMAYQPPLLGFKQLLNFGAFSIPDTGGWIFAGAGLVIVLAAIAEMRRKPGPSATATGGKNLLVILFVCAGFLSSCNSGPQPIDFGKDNCDFCKMTIVDKHFGAEVVTRKGKIFKFDDIHCLVSSLRSDVPAKKEVGSIYFVDYGGGPWIRAESCQLLRSDSLHSPMNGNIAAFPTVAARDELQKKLSGQCPTWKEISPY